MSDFPGTGTPITSKGLPKKTIGLVIAGILAFWFIDVPWTVRAKVLLMRVMPIGGETVDEMTRTLCKNVYGPTWYSCYDANRDEAFWKEKFATDAASEKETARRQNIFKFCDAVRKPEREEQGFICVANDDGESKATESCLYLGGKIEWDLGSEGKIKLMYVELFEDGCRMIFDDSRALSACGDGECPE